VGVFDTLKCEYPLPDPAHQDLGFQTKNLGGFLDRYTILRDGRLILHRRPEPGAELDRDIERPVHGDIRIYDYLDATKEFIEYRVRFTQGRVEWIRRFEEREDEPLVEPT